MSLTTGYKALAINGNFTKTAIITADSFVDFKRKAASELGMSGWMKVVVHKGRSKEGGQYLATFLS